jgi:hypothetical protein
MRLRWLANILYPRLRALAARRSPNFEVVREHSTATKHHGDVYLRRWNLIPRNSIFNIYLHAILRDDDAVLHDHPYASVSLCLAGRLEENYSLRPADTAHWHHAPNARRAVLPGDVVWRSARMAHRLVVRDPNTWTVFITGPRVREWGFWCPRGWVPWRSYMGAGQDSGRGGVSGLGRGCGE